MSDGVPATDKWHHAQLALVAVAPDKRSNVKLIRLPGVFPPHPETELLLSALAEHGGTPARALDLCTGTGVLALHLARLGAGDVTAVDLGRRAVLTAKLNARRHGIALRVLRGDLFAPVAGRRFDLITSNPPYVPAATADLPTHGPKRAFDAGLDGRALLDRICASARDHLTPGGRLLLTHSNVAGVEESCRRLELAGLDTQVLNTRTDAFGPVMRARAELFWERGLLEHGTYAEELVVIEARAPRTARFIRTPQRFAIPA